MITLLFTYDIHYTHADIIGFDDFIKYKSSPACYSSEPRIAKLLFSNPSPSLLINSNNIFDSLRFCCKYVYLKDTEGKKLLALRSTLCEIFRI